MRAIRSAFRAVAAAIVKMIPSVGTAIMASLIARILQKLGVLDDAAGFLIAMLAFIWAMRGRLVVPW